MIDYMLLFREISYAATLAFGYWIGQRGFTGIVTDIKGDISHIKSMLSGMQSTTSAPVVVPTPTVTPNVPVVV